MRFRHAGDLDVPQPRPCLRYAVFDLPGQSGSCSFLHATTVTYVTYARTRVAGVRVSADLDPSRFWIPYDVTQGMRSGVVRKMRVIFSKMEIQNAKNTPKFFQKMQNITQNAGKIRSVAMATKMATVFWTGKLVFL